MPHIGTLHGYDTIEVPFDCNDIRRDGVKTQKGKDWEDTDLQPESYSPPHGPIQVNKIVRLTAPSDWHLTRITVHRPPKVVVDGLVN